MAGRSERVAISFEPATGVRGPSSDSARRAQITGTGLSTGAIYRYFIGKEEIVIAVCEQGSSAFPTALTRQAVDAFLEHVRTLSRDKGHARLTAQIYAEAGLSPALASIVQQQLSTLRSAVADPGPRGARR